MDKFKAELKEDITLFQLVEIIKYLIKYLNIEIDEATYNKLPNSIKRHFKKIT